MSHLSSIKVERACIWRGMNDDREPCGKAIKEITGSTSQVVCSDHGIAYRQKRSKEMYRARRAKGKQVA